QEMRHLLEIAAEKHNAEAALELGKYYENGIADPDGKVWGRNPVPAENYYMRAFAYGSDEALARLDAMKGSLHFADEGGVEVAKKRIRRQVADWEIEAAELHRQMEREDAKQKARDARFADHPGWDTPIGKTQGLHDLDGRIASLERYRGK